MEQELKLDLLKVLVKHNIIPENFVRNEEMKIEYKKMRAEGLSGKQARIKLSEIHFMSIKNVEAILYGKN